MIFAQRAKIGNHGGVRVARRKTMKGKGSDEGPRRANATAKRSASRVLLIRQMRESAGLNLKDVAPLLGLSQSAYSRKELAPENFRSEELQLLSQFFNVPIGALVDPSEASTVSLGSFKRVVPVYAMRKARESEREQIGQYAPTAPAFVEAYALEVTDDTMADGARSLRRGDWCVIDPASEIRPGDIVHAIDPATGMDVLRTYSPLHPSNPRAPGILLKASAPSVDDIYVPSKDASCIKGRVMERRSVF